MRTADLDYDFDPSLVAREPAAPRDAARMLVYQRASRRIEHRHVRDLPEFLRQGDALVVNETHVAPVRIKAVRERGGTARIEGLLLERRGPREWYAILRNAKRIADDERLTLVGPELRDSPQSPWGLTVLGREGEGWRVRLEGGGGADDVLAAVGWTPLPPYIIKSRKDSGQVDDGHSDGADRQHYQTVYASATGEPSVAAPTAGLHFTPELLAAIAVRGVERIAVSLQVGAGTFKPIETDTLDEHVMHRERCVVTRRAIERLRDARSHGARVVAVGTTSVRTLESMPQPCPELPVGTESLVWDTDILIAPGYRFTMVDALMTNFHLPRSTLIALIAAMIGLDELKRVYAVAIAERYRFYSYGDAMLIL